MIRRLIPLAFSAALFGLSAMAAPVQVTSETGDAKLIQALEAELSGTEAPETLFAARRQAQRAARQARDYLNSLGYYAPVITPVAEEGPPPAARLIVEPGPLFTLTDIQIDLGAAEVSSEAQAAMDRVRTLKPGDAGIPKAILAEEAGLLAALKAMGYAEATTGERRALGDREAGTLTLTYRFTPGPKIKFGTINYPDNTTTRTDYLDKLVPFEAGEDYTPSDLSLYNRRLNATRLYDFVTAQLAETPVAVDADGTETRNVDLHLTPRDRYTLATGASYSTSEGPGLTASLTRRNATRRGDTLKGAMTLASLERSVAVDWTIPNITRFDRTLVLSAKATRDETDAYDREAITTSGTFTVKHSRHLTYALNATSEFTSEEDSFSQRDQQILSVSAGARLDHANDALDPTSGWRADARVEPAVAIGDQAAQFFTLNGQLSAYQALDKDDTYVLAARVRNGYVLGASLEDLPVSRRFYAGGGGSARGFEYQSVGPTDADGTPTGGLSLLEASAELRWRRKGKLGFVGFVDGATVGNTTDIDLEDFRYSAGAGVRYDTPVGPIRFDVAVPIDRQAGDESFQIYVSIGQAF